MFRWLVNAGFLALPIAATLGILLGIQSHRQATGQTPLFVPHLDNKWVEKTYCQKAIGIHPETKGQEFTLNPNQWGVRENEPGFLCMNVTTFNNQTYATDTTAPSFSAVWQYNPRNPNTHAFPNIKVGGQHSGDHEDVLPARMNAIKRYGFDVEWSMRLDNDTATETDVADLTSKNVNANVAIDMFIDADKEKAVDSVKATHELMVWLAAVGLSSHALGQEKGAIAVKELHGTTFELFSGLNRETNQTVLTWKAKKAAPKFHGDLTPLVDFVLKADRPEFPKSSHYLGYFAFGSEAYDSPSPVTFSVPSLSIDIQKS